MSISAMIQHTTCNLLHSKVKDSPIQRLFRPKYVAVIGATDRDGSVGKTIVLNLKKCLQTKENKMPQETFEILPVNPTRDVCCGLKCYKSIEQCPKGVDIAIIVTPAHTVKDLIESCGKASVPVAVVISAGFKELGDVGLKLEQEVLQVAQKHNVRIIGPNCLGVMAPHIGLNATFAADHAIPGSIAFLSQSGAMCTAILDWALDLKIGFSAFVSIGSMADIEWGDFLGYFERDQHTKSIVIYMETIGNVQKFLSAARAVSSRMPIFVIKAGQTDAAAIAAASHTGSLVGSHDAFLAGMKRAGIMVLENIDELFNVLLVLGKQPQPSSRGHLTIITNAGGPGVLATDAAAINNAILHPLKQEMIKSLDAILPAAWSHANPIDVLGDASAELYAKTLTIALNDEESDGVLVILSPQSVTEPTPTAQAVIKAVKEAPEHLMKSKTILCAWMGSKEVSEGMKLLNNYGIPTFAFPDSAAKIFGKLATYKYERKQLIMNLVQKVPKQSKLLSYCPTISTNTKDHAICLLKQVQQSKRTLLTEAESKQLLEIYGISIAKTMIAKTAKEAGEYSKQVQYPCVIKLHSSTITHKSDVGGVQLNIKSIAEAEQAFNTIKKNLASYGKESEFEGVTVQPMLDISKGIELILGSINDPQFGHLILFGTGGCMVEIYKDSALGLPPLDIIQAQTMIDSTKISKALHQTHGSRFQEIDFDQLVLSLCRFSVMIQHLSPYVSECDINPLLAMSDRCIALDARIILKSDLKPEQFNPSIYQNLSALPNYPSQYNCESTLKKANASFSFKVTQASDYYQLSEFLSLNIAQNKDLEHVLKQSDGAPAFDIYNHIIPPMLFADYYREIPIALCEIEANQILGVAYLRKHPLNHHAAMLQFIVSEYNNNGRYTQDEYQKCCKEFLKHIVSITKQEDIHYIVSQLFRQLDATIFQSCEFNVNQDPNSKLFVCVYDKLKTQ